MRLAVLSDIHGNPIALDAVLADIRALGGADEYLILGDIVATGPEPVGVLERLTALEHVRFVQGNTDRYVVTGDRPYPGFADVEANAALIPRIVEVAHSFAWTQGVVHAAGWFDWLAALPLEVTLELADGSRLLGVHVAPGENDGAGIHPRLGESELTGHVANIDADVVCVGHTHWPLDRAVNGKRIVNVGSVSNPMAADLRACYAVVESDASGYRIEHRRVSYDVDAVLEAIERSRHPSGGYIASHFRGERQPWWRSA